jgi:hypothetical protein
MKLITNSGGSNLFAAEYLAENPDQDGKVFYAYSVERANSGKGYFIRCDGFSAWIFKNSVEAKTLLPLLEQWSSPKSKHGYGLIVQLASQQTRTGCLLGIDEEQKYSWVKSALVEVFTATKV